MHRKENEKFAILIPTRDEAANILLLLSRIQAALERAEIHYEIVVVDDDSRDGTAEQVSAAAMADKRIRLLVRRGERGLAGAILHGWQNTDAEILGVIDADLQHPPELLPALFEAIIAGRDLAIASRYIEGGKVDGWNPARRILSAVAAWVCLPLQTRGLRARDPLSGFFLVRRRCVSGLDFQKKGFKLLLEILIRGRVSSFQEIPYCFGRRGAGRSKAGIGVALDYIALMARLYRRRYGLSRLSHPLTAERIIKSPDPRF